MSPVTTDKWHLVGLSQVKWWITTLCHCLLSLVAAISGFAMPGYHGKVKLEQIIDRTAARTLTLITSFLKSFSASIHRHHLSHFSFSK